MTSPRVVKQRNHGLIPIRAIYFSLVEVQDGSGVHPAFYSAGFRGYFFGGEGLAFKAYLLLE